MLDTNFDLVNWKYNINCIQNNSTWYSKNISKILHTRRHANQSEQHLTKLITQVFLGEKYHSGTSTNLGISSADLMDYQA